MWLAYSGSMLRTSLFKPWLAVHRVICKDNLSLYLAALKAYRRSRGMSPMEAVKEILKILVILMALLDTKEIAQAPEKTILKGQPRHSYF